MSKQTIGNSKPAQEIRNNCQCLAVRNRLINNVYCSQVQVISIQIRNIAFSKIQYAVYHPNTNFSGLHPMIM